MQGTIKINDNLFQITGLGLTGFTRANTDDLRLYAAVEFAAPDYSVKLFKDPSRESAFLVASGGTTEAGASVTLNEENSSGISGSAKLNYSADDDDIEILLGYADISDLCVYEAGIEALLPVGEEDFHPQHNEAFFQINQLLRQKLREEISTGGDTPFIDAVQDKRCLTRA